MIVSNAFLLSCLPFSPFLGVLTIGGMLCPSQFGPWVGSLCDKLCGVRALHPAPRPGSCAGMCHGTFSLRLPSMWPRPPAGFGGLAVFPGQTGSASPLTPFVVGTSSLWDSVLVLVGQVLPQQRTRGAGGGVLPAVTLQCRAQRLATCRGLRVPVF